MGVCRRAFSTIEYAVLIAIVVAALIGASVYVKRALSGKWREAADTFGHGRQYAKGAASVPTLPITPPTLYPCETTFYQTCVDYFDGTYNIFIHFDIGKNESKVNIKWHYSDGTKTYDINLDGDKTTAAIDPFGPGAYTRSVHVTAARIYEDWLIKDGNKIEMSEIYHGPESHPIPSNWCLSGWNAEWNKPLCE